ncbi:MAG: DUF3307 domain-containing protein [Muribaculaceae bacterium]|nr:DUF3307 domain-containing protein [Muribaculaceae bacterium]
MLYVLFTMIFFHILDDFCLQSCWLVDGKQRAWWERNAPDHMYRHDYIVALLVHGFSWSFATMIPLMVCIGGKPTAAFYIMLIGNALLHSLIDDMKANRKRINLIADQLFHLLQLILAFVVVGVLRW